MDIYVIFTLLVSIFIAITMIFLYQLSRDD
ncbi:hypothetical protein SATMO3_39980 [Sporomusa aerivorans]